MAAITAAQSAWPRASLLDIVLGWVPCRGVFSQLKRCRVRNLTVAMTGDSYDDQRHGGARLYSSAIPGNALVVDPAMRAASWSKSDTGFTPMTVMPLVS